ncbi:MAG: chemotaxis protein CheW [Myxococcales bacterium]|nr:chemotaxis protein CheW [Myxococcales bacterium]
MDDLDDVVQEFLIESYENLDQLERDLVILEESPNEPEVIARIFRTIHTIKGTCGFLGYSKLEALTHVGENLLSRIRDGAIQLDGAIATALLKTVDAVREMLANIEHVGEEGDGDYSALVAELTRLLEPGASEEAEAQASEPAAQASEPVVEVEPRSAGVSEAAPVAATIESDFEQAIEEAAAQAPVAAPSAPPTETKVPEAAAVVDSEEAFSSESRSGSTAVADSSIRVHVDLLDKLMNLVGELVLARNQILQFADEVDNQALQATTQRLNLVTTELQEGVMRTRMQPIGTVWSKLPRVVRDLARTCRKQVRLEMEGKETGLDRTLIEAIKDPLTHLVRNCVDHGIERPDDRRAAGKDPVGVLQLRAYHEGGQVNIEIADDGAGISPEKLKQRALDRGLLSAEQLSRMGERQLLNLIFLPGFSTAEQVTNVSGRGVGMDVVKTNIERIGGTVDLHSAPGKGTTFKVKIPLTLAIIPALIVRCGGERYAIPQVSLLELVRLEGEQVRSGIERIQSAPVYRLRGQLLPLVYLNQELGIESPTDGQDEICNIVVLQADDRQFGLVVDGVQDTEEIVVKPLGKQLKAASAFAGATIMGDGRVALILDVLGLAQQARVISEAQARDLSEVLESESSERGDRQTLLLVDVNQRPFAIPLSKVARLEELPATALESVGTYDVIQYRGDIMPVAHLGAVVNHPNIGSGGGDRDVMHVVVYSQNGRNVGVAVDTIRDIVDEHVDLRPVGRRNGVLGSTVVQGRVVELIDLDAVVSTVSSHIFEDSLPMAAGA